MEFAIVEFVDDTSVAVVPTNWLDGDNDAVCCWPLVSKLKAVERLVKGRVEPSSDWLKFSVRILHKYGMFITLIVNIASLVLHLTVFCYCILLLKNCMCIRYALQFNNFTIFAMTPFELFAVVFN